LLNSTEAGFKLFHASLFECSLLRLPIEYSIFSCNFWDIPLVMDRIMKIQMRHIRHTDGGLLGYFTTLY